jgi:glycolate oxidase iron-sulfur subunit
MKPGLKDTDRCVMCGLCLPHCPTYALSRQEGDSPRGRISLMQALAAGRLTADERVSAHLEGCLGCRACEAMCPSGVPFGRLMDAGRALLREQRGDRYGVPAVVRPTLGAGGTGRAAAAVLHLYQKSGLHGALMHTPLVRRGVVGRAMNLLPPQATPVLRSGVYRPEGDTRGSVQLFSGCTGAAFEGNALTAARDLLLRLGYEVEVPAAQGCCGALDLHSGHCEGARAAAARNLDAFGTSEVPLIALNSGCRTQLREYTGLIPGDGTSDFAARVQDLCGFLLAHEQDLFALSRSPAPRANRPDPGVRPEGRVSRVAVHLPCTLRNVLREHGVMLELLRRTPGTEVVELDGNERCCGAAGSHMLTHPEAADTLLAPKVEAVKRLAPEAVITANIGCSLHFQAGLRRAGIRVPVVTPAEWVLSRIRAL